MKKNAMLKIAAILLVAVLLTTCAISATFAKYVTSDKVETEKATVAKWGVSVTAEVANGDFFKESYAATIDGESETVVSATTDVIAPGTKCDNALVLEIKGAPEVAMTIDTSKLAVDLEGWTVDLDGDGNSEPYMPVVFTVDIYEKEGVKKSSEPMTAAEINDYFDTLGTSLNTAGEKYIAPSTEGVYRKVVISWAWAYEVTGNNEKDTYLGDHSDANTISIGGTVSVSQYGIDSAI
jgi:uncharacterized lipoprotein YajG